LSKISKEYYGTPNDYSKIADANNISDPDLIKVGQELTIPPA
jgi:nucleoid-associated protein YgaU